VYWLRVAPVLRGAVLLCASLCFVFAGLLSVAGRAHASTAEEVRKKIAELQAVLKDFDGKQPVFADIGELRKSLLDRKLVGDGVKDIFIQHSSELQSLLKDDQSRQLIRDNAKTAPSLEALYDALDQLALDALLKKRATLLLDRLTGLIATSDSNALMLSKALHAPATGIATEDKALQEARKSFEPAWTSISQDLKIHVIRAWFGDLRTNWREGRQCHATSTIMTKCEAQAECKLDAAPATQPGAAYDHQVLCGFDPAPRVDPAHKGVAVNFVCARGTKLIWDEIAKQPGINPETKVPWQEHEINLATLRSSGMSFRCPFPVKPVGGG
jgi:hypothetical protein